MLYLFFRADHALVFSQIDASNESGIGSRNATKSRIIGTGDEIYCVGIRGYFDLGGCDHDVGGILCILGPLCLVFGCLDDVDIANGHDRQYDVHCIVFVVCGGNVSSDLWLRAHGVQESVCKAIGGG